MRTYNDDQSGESDATIFTKRRLITRFEAFGMRAFAGYDAIGGTPFGVDGGSPLFSVVPMAVQPDCSGELTNTSRQGGTQLPNPLPPDMYVDSGTLWVPFPATVYVDWPDKGPLNRGMVRWSIESFWDVTNLNRGFSFTRFLRNGQTITVPPNSNRLVCDNPNAAIVIGPDTIQTGQTPVPFGGSPTIQMLFLATMPAAITRAPVVFYYSL